MPKFRTFEKIYKELNVKQIQETPRIPEEELPSNNCPIADHNICDELFDYEEGVGRLLWKGKFYRLDSKQNEQFRQILLKDMEENDAKHNDN